MVLIPSLEFQTDWLLQRRYEPARGSTAFPNPKRRIKSILDQFRNKHARYDIETAREMSYHTYCDPDMANRASEILSPKFKGRVFSEEDWSVLEQMSLLAKGTGREFEIHDISSVKGTIIAMKCGIRKTPAMVMNGEKFEGKERVLEPVTTK